jgi:hypothetical protein
VTPGSSRCALGFLTENPIAQTEGATVWVARIDDLFQNLPGMAPSKVLLRLFDLGIDADAPPSQLQIALDAFGHEQRAPLMPYAVDHDGVCELDICFEVPLGARLAEALASDDEQASDVFLVVYSVDTSVPAAVPILAEVGSAHLSLRSLLAAPAQHDMTLELLDEAGLVAGAVSLCVESAAEALSTLLAAARPQLTPPPPPPHFARAGAAAGSDTGLVVSLGALHVWPEASAAACQLPSCAKVFVALELATGPPASQCESRSVYMSRWRAVFGCAISLPLRARSSERDLLRVALAAGSDEEESDLHLVLLRETARGAQEFGSGFVNLRAVMRGWADCEPRTFAIVSDSGERIGALTVALRAESCLCAIAAEAGPLQAEAGAACTPAVAAAAFADAAGTTCADVADGSSPDSCDTPPETSGRTPSANVTAPPRPDDKVARTLDRIRRNPRGLRTPDVPALPPVRAAALVPALPRCSGVAGEARAIPLQVEVKGEHVRAPRPTSAEVASRRAYLLQKRDLIRKNGGAAAAEQLADPTAAVVVESPKRRVRAGAVDALAASLGQTLDWQQRTRQ